MYRGRKLEKLILAAILAGSVTVAHGVSAGVSDYLDFSHRGEATTIIYNFGGKFFMNVRFYISPEGYIGIKGDEKGEEKNSLRPFLAGEEKAVSQGLKYWYDALGAPATIPYVDIYLTESPSSNAAGESEAFGDITKLAKCFQEKINNDPSSYDALMMIDMPQENKKYYTDKLGILPTNGADDDYQGTIVHEMFHTLGVMTSFDARFENGEAAIKPHIFTRYENNLYDFKGQKLTDSNKMVIIESPQESRSDKTFYFLHEKAGDNSYFEFNGVYFKGKHVDEVLNLNDHQALIAWPDDYKLEPVPGIPINGIEPAWGDAIIADLSHFELQNSLQSHQRYRNWSIPMEVELAALEDIGYTMDRRKLYGNSVYNSGIEYVNNNPFYERRDSQYIDGTPSTQSLAIGLHIYGSNNMITQNSQLLADGDESMGIRVDGVNNKLTIAKDSKVTANGLNGRGINFAYGKEHGLNVEGTVTALGEGGKALVFDFGDNMLGNGREYRGSYIRVKVDDNKVYNNTTFLPALEGALVNDVNISGIVKGKDAAIYIAPNAYVQYINVKSGAELQGDIISDWSPTGGFPDVLGKDFTVKEKHIRLPEDQDGLTRLNFAGDKLNYAGDIGSSSLEYGSFIMNVNSGMLNYEGTAKIASVDVAKDAILQGGTFKLDKEGSHIRKALSKDNSGKLINKGMISAALPKGEDTVMLIDGNVVNDGGTMAFIGNAGSQGRIKIDGSLEGDKVLAINPNGIYLPGDSYDISNLVTVNGESLVFEDTQTYKNGLLEAAYSNDNKQITFDLTEAISEEGVALSMEMSNLGRALAKHGRTDDEMQVAELFKLEPEKAIKVMKGIKGQQAANIPAVMQQNNLIRNTLSMHLSQVNRARAVKVNVPVKQLTEKKTIAVPKDITVQTEYDMWAKVSHNKGAINAASDYKTNAYSIGWDKQVNKDWRFGFFGSCVKGKFEADTIYNRLEDYRLGMYGSYNKGAAEAVVYADYGWGKNKQQRTLIDMGVNTKADYDSNIMEIGVEYKYDLQKYKNRAWNVTPYGALQLNRYKQSDYLETGAEPFNKNVGKLNNTYVGVEAGLELERNFANGSGYGIRMGYKRGLKGVEPRQSYYYAADPEHRYTNYGEGDKNKLVFRLNGEIQTAPHWSLSSEAGYECGKKGHGYGGEISLKYTW